MLADGSLGRQSASPLAEAPTGKLALVKRLELGGQTYFSGSVLGSTAIDVWRADAASGWQSTYAQTATMGASSRGLTSMETVLIGGNRFLLTTSDGQSAMTLYQLNTLGQLTPRSQIGMENGSGSPTLRRCGSWLWPGRPMRSSQAPPAIPSARCGSTPMA